MCMFWYILYYNFYDFYLIFSSMTSKGPYNQILTIYTFQNFNSANIYWMLNINDTLSYGSAYCI